MKYLLMHLAILLCFVRVTYAQKGYFIKRYYGKDTNLCIVQWEKIKSKRMSIFIEQIENLNGRDTLLKRKVRMKKYVEKLVTNELKVKKGYGILEGYTETIDGHLLISVINLLDTTKMYHVIGSCLSNKCDLDNEGPDCDACVPIHFRISVPTDGIYALRVSRIEYSPTDSIFEIKKLITKFNNSSSQEEWYTIYHYLTYSNYKPLFQDDNYQKIKKFIPSYIFPIYINTKRPKKILYFL